MTEKTKKSPLAPPQGQSSGKAERALSIKQGVAANRKGKPIAFPVRRYNP